ncbi:MAG: hypothetical protein EZS28_021969 [Streblomastix strix]|uniref:SANT domain-containing protein n=1 Tax=Streblomastix strix TaxID=222440 RepID=A0A5J4VJ51_9EUKA|nr:MAG: hypothetical protein EZS28_021969 [Streblomastix strix]
MVQKWSDEEIDRLRHLIVIYPYDFQYIKQFFFTKSLTDIIFMFNKMKHEDGEDFDDYIRRYYDFRGINELSAIIIPNRFPIKKNPHKYSKDQTRLVYNIANINSAKVIVQISCPRSQISPLQLKQFAQEAKWKQIIQQHKLLMSEIRSQDGIPRRAKKVFLFKGVANIPKSLSQQNINVDIIHNPNVDFHNEHIHMVQKWSDEEIDRLRHLIVIYPYDFQYIKQFFFTKSLTDIIFMFNKMKHEDGEDFDDYIRRYYDFRGINELSAIIIPNRFPIKKNPHKYSKDQTSINILDLDILSSSSTPSPINSQSPIPSISSSPFFQENKFYYEDQWVLRMNKIQDYSFLNEGWRRQPKHITKMTDQQLVRLKVLTSFEYLNSRLHSAPAQFDVYQLPNIFSPFFDPIHSSMIHAMCAAQEKEKDITPLAESVARKSGGAKKYLA